MRCVSPRARAECSVAMRRPHRPGGRHAKAARAAVSPRSVDGAAVLGAPSRYCSCRGRLRRYRRPSSLDINLENDYIKEIRETIEPGHSALFLLVQDVTPEVMISVLQQSGGKIMKAELSYEDEIKLRDAFDADDLSA